MSVLGIVLRPQEDHRFLLNANAIYQVFRQLHLLSDSTKINRRWYLDNLDGVFTLGGEGELRYSYKKLLTAGATLTYQQLENRQQYVFDSNGNLIVSPVYKDQMPNIPYFFGNADASVTLARYWPKRKRAQHRL
jgi:hypothetical protein